MAHDSPRRARVGSLRVLLEEQATARGTAPYLLSIRSEHSVTYAQLVAECDRWRATLAAWKVHSGDRVGLLVADPLDFVVTLLALIAEGVWVAPLDPTVLGGEHLAGRVASLRLRAVLSDRADPQGLGVEWFELSTSSSLSHGSEAIAALGPLDGGILLATSGTTGTPKVVALPAEQLIAAARLVAHHNHLTAQDRGLNPLPLWHINAEVVAVLATLVAGGSLVLDERFHRTGFWDAATRLKVTWINAVPAIVAHLATLQPGEVAPSTVRFIRSASAPLPAALLEQFETNVGIAVVEAYGMTEAASQITANPLDGPRKAGSVGRAVGVELRVAPMVGGDLDGSGVREGVGHVEIRGPSIITSYEASGYEDRFDAEGWLRTGDLGYLDEDGFLFLVGRSDDVINRGGEKIFPREIEELVLEVKGVNLAAVIGRHDDVFGQVPVLYVELHDVGGATTLDELRTVTGAINDVMVASFAQARRPVVINVVERMPTHATGKIQRKALDSDAVTLILEEPLR